MGKIYLYNKKITEPQPGVCLHQKATWHIRNFKHKQNNVNKAFIAQGDRSWITRSQVPEPGAVGSGPDWAAC